MTSPIGAERWADVRGYEGRYQVSDRGAMKSLARTTRGGRKMPERLMKAVFDANGRPSVTLWFDNTCRTARVHTLVAQCFVEGEEGGLVVCHNDGDKTNNVWTNLRWDTQAGNLRDMLKHGTHWQARKTHCPQGHEYTPENTVQTKRGRGCRECKNESARVRHALTVDEQNARRRERYAERAKDEKFMEAKRARSRATYERKKEAA